MGDGRLFIQYSNGTIHDVWQNEDVFNGSQNITGNFTTPANVSSFQVGTEVVLDNGNLNFDDLTLTAYSNYIDVAPPDLHRLTAQITGELDADFGQGGQIWVVYENLAGQTLSSTLLWSNPADFSGMATMQADFNPGLLPPTVVIRMALETNLDAGHLAFSNFELQHLDSGDIIRRSTYSLAGQPIAVKVAGDPVNENNGIFYTYSDHLGSASVMSYGYNLNGSPHPQAGQPVPYSEARYLPFGGWRGAAPTAGLTDRGFTGHKHNNLSNNDIGLIYMNARYYVVGISRFASADSIIPNPTNPQSYNRYSYTRNNPLNRIDPTGHVDCGLLGDPDDVQACSNATPLTPLIEFTGVKGHEWSVEEKAVVLSGAWQVAKVLFEASGGQFASPREAFLAVYGGTVTFHKMGTVHKEGAMGEAMGKRTINVHIHKTAITSSSAGSMWAAHELGHAFNNALSPNTTDNLNYGQGLIDLALKGVTTADGERFTGIPLNSKSYSNYDLYRRATDLGYQSEAGPHVQNDNPWPNEDFADMFSNWAYNSFAQDKYGAARYNFMDSRMKGWIDLAVSNNQ